MKKKTRTYALECTQCKSRNYKVTRSAESAVKKKIELKKYCKFCSGHVLHKEVR